VRDEATAEWRIEPAELHRLYPVADAQGAPQHDAQAATMAHRSRSGVGAQLTDKDTVRGSRRRLDEERTERRQTAMADRGEERIVALLTDQRTTTSPSTRRP
jgi:hypothetical protein